MDSITMNADNTITFGRCCPICGTMQAVRVSVGSYVSWQTGVLIQDAMPELNADQREFFLTGICPPCWDILFPESEESDD